MARVRGFVDAAAAAVEAFGDCEYEARAAALAQIGAPDHEQLLAESLEVKRLAGRPRCPADAAAPAAAAAPACTSPDGP